MSDFLTTREVAGLLRIKERKVYDLVATGGLPVRRVTGKLLFPRLEIERLVGGLPAAAVTAVARPPMVMTIAGGHDPLLEWALRESRSGLAAFLDGAIDGLERAANGVCAAAGLHIPQADGGWNIDSVRERMGEGPWVLVEWARRQRGLIWRRDLASAPRTLKATRGLRFQLRQPEAGSELVLDLLLRREGLGRDDLHAVGHAERSENDLALAIASGRADVGLGIMAGATHYDLGFEPLITERFDLLVRRRAWFEPEFQRLWQFCAGTLFRDRAKAMGGYDLSAHGTVHFNGGAD